MVSPRFDSSASHGKAGRGKAGRDLAWQGKGPFGSTATDGSLRFDSSASHGEAGLGKAGLGAAWQGEGPFGSTATDGSLRFDSSASHGPARRGTAWHGWAWHGLARRGTLRVDKEHMPYTPEQHATPEARARSAERRSTEAYLAQERRRDAKRRPPPLDRTVEYEGRVWSSLRVLCGFHGLSLPCVRYRLRTMSLAQALRAPLPRGRMPTR